MNGRRQPRTACCTRAVSAAWCVSPPRLHLDARRDRFVFARALSSILLGAFSGRSVFQSAEPYLASAYIPVSEEFGRLLYVTARATGARNIVEFGSSFGVSSIYLAAAQANDGRWTSSSWTAGRPSTSRC
ncbi:hypothetical protein [Hyphomonas sp.]|uniref:hypothetical protein n=1 Tax=Hyphomonas sp. TaxID=87 RepID=UPI0025BF4857|nr:hypothetical protein [Hyphomonas sp.]MBI1398546.1 hypothetical protein [Hyphomonas sp.]